MHKILFIGVGGTGGKILRFAWREIDARMRALDETRPLDALPASFQFIHFDLPEQFDGYKDKDVPRVASLDDRLYNHLGDKGLRYRDYDGQLIADGLLEGIWGWRPHPLDSIPNPYVGAGQRRAVGRAMAVVRLGRIDDAIRGAAELLGSTDATSEMSHVEELFNPDDIAVQEDGRVFVVGSIAGGSGAGIFLDVLERVRAQSVSWFANSELVLVTPDAFSSGPPGEREGNEPNALASISEYLTAFAWEGEPHPAEAAIAGSVGAIRGTGRRTGDRAFLIGGGNGKVSFPNASDLFRSVGKSLAAYATTPAIQAYFDSVVCNLSGSTSNPGYFFADRGRSPLQPISSFGFGAVSTGGDRLADYGAERLALASLRRLLSEDRQTQTLPEYVESRTQDLRRDDFFLATGLWEYDPKDPTNPPGAGSRAVHNQVLDRLRDVEEVKKRALDAAEAVLASLKGDVRRLAAETARQELIKRFDETLAENDRAAHAERSARARAWTTDVQDQLVAATLTVVANDGVAVAVRLLDLLMKQIDDAVEQLDDEGKGCARNENTFIGNAARLYEGIKDRVVGASDTHRKAAQFRNGALFQRWEAHVRDEAAQLLREANQGLVAPLRAGLRRFEASLTAQRADINGAGAIVRRWSDGAVPDHLKAAANERLLYPEKTMPADFERLLAETTGQRAPMDAVAVAVSEIIRGRWDSNTSTTENTDGGTSLIEATGTWNSRHPFAQRSGSASFASFAAISGVLDILDRSRDWVLHRRGSLSLRVDETLRDYLDPAAEDHTKRLRVFRTELINALNSAKPLVAINERVRTKIHGDTTETSFTMTPLPLPTGHPARTVAEKALLNAGVDAKALGQYFTSDKGGRQAEIFGFMTKSVHPVVVSSLMDPIAAAWSQSSATPEDRETFWAFRRARTVEAFMGLGPSLQRAIVRGWYVAAFFGYLDGVDPKPGVEIAPRVWSPDGWRSFPSPLLGAPARSRQEVLPAILESFPLRLLELSVAEADPADGYSRLLELGGGGRGAGTEDPYVVLAAWLREGTFTDGKPSPPKFPYGARVGEVKTADVTLSDAEARRRAALDALRTPRAVYDNEVARITPDPAVFAPDRRWEISGLVLAALDDLIAFVEGIPLTAVAEDEPINV